MLALVAVSFRQGHLKLIYDARMTRMMEKDRHMKELTLKLTFELGGISERVPSKVRIKRELGDGMRLRHRLFTSR